MTLKELRQNSNLQQHQLSSLIGVAISKYSLYENGIELPSLKQIIQLERYFGQKIDWPDIPADEKHEFVTSLLKALKRYPVRAVLEYVRKNDITLIV